MRKSTRFVETISRIERVVDRIRKKWETAKSMVPGPEFYQSRNLSSVGMVFYGTSTYAALEAMQIFKKKGLRIDAMRLRSVPFNKKVESFMEKHDTIFVIELNKDGQMRTVLINELELHPRQLIPVLNYDGFPITADTIVEQITAQLATEKHELVNA